MDEIDVSVQYEDFIDSIFPCITDHKTRFRHRLGEHSGEPIGLHSTTAEQCQYGNPIVVFRLSVTWDPWINFQAQSPRVGSWVLRIDPLRFLAGCCKGD